MTGDTGRWPTRTGETFPSPPDHCPYPTLPRMQEPAALAALDSPPDGVELTAFWCVCGWWHVRAIG